MCAEVGAQGLGPAVLPYDGRGQRLAGPGIPGQHGLALIRQRNRVDRAAGLVEGGASGAEHGLQQFCRVLLDAAAVEVARVDSDLGNAYYTLLGIDNDRLGARGALVDGQYRHFTASSVSPATWSSSASIEASSGIFKPSLPRVTSR